MSQRRPGIPRHYLSAFLPKTLEKRLRLPSNAVDLTVGEIPEETKGATSTNTLTKGVGERNDQTNPNLSPFTPATLQHPSRVFWVR